MLKYLGTLATATYHISPFQISVIGSGKIVSDWWLCGNH